MENITEYVCALWHNEYNNSISDEWYNYPEQFLYKFFSESENIISLDALYNWISTKNNISQSLINTIKWDIVGYSMMEVWGNDAIVSAKLDGDRIVAVYQNS